MVSDAQVRKLFKEMRDHGRISKASQRAGMSLKTARKYITTQKLPAQLARQRDWRTRSDPFEKDWPIIEGLLVATPHIGATALFEKLVVQNPCGYKPNQLRTLQRRVSQWRAKHPRFDGQAAHVWITEVIQGAKAAASLREELEVPISSPDLERLLGYGSVGGLKVRNKAVTILSRHRGIKNSAIARVLRLTPKTTEQYFRTFSAFGLERLFDTRRKLPTDELPQTAKRLLNMLHHRPSAFGYNRSAWTLKLLAEEFEQQYDRSLSDRSVSRYLKKAGFHWRKARRVLTSSDPQYRKKVGLVLETLRGLTSTELFFFVDELGPLAVKKYGGRSYVPKGTRKTFPQVQVPKGTVILSGALNATTNQMTWCFGDSKDTNAMIDLMELLFNQYHDKKKLYITWDAASWHDSNGLVEWLDEFNKQTELTGKGPLMEFVPLPSCSQFLNVIESVFSGMKRAVIHNSDYSGTTEMKTAISRQFTERNGYFSDNPRRAGKKIWEVDFFRDYDNLKSGNYREW